jgi:hypothetical protein
VAICVIVGVNGRVFLVSLVALVVLYAISRRVPWFGYVFAGTSLALCATPFWWGRFSELFVNAVGQSLVGSTFASSSKALETVEGRSYIWDVCMSHLRNSDFAHQVFGYGPDGHITSGAAYDYSALFSAQGSAWRAGFYSTHNALLLLLLSHGIFWAIVSFLLVLVGSIQRLRESRGEERTLFVLLLFVWGAASATSIVTTPAILSSSLLLYALLTGKIPKPATELDPASLPSLAARS